MILYLEYISSEHYIYMGKGARILGYFSKPKWLREQKSFGKHCYREFHKKPDYKIKKADLKCGSPRNVTGPTSF
jgi:hypothetical protein